MFKRVVCNKVLLCTRNIRLWRVGERQKLIKAVKGKHRALDVCGDTGEGVGEDA